MKKLDNREISINLLKRMAFRNLFSTIYFFIVGLILSAVYTHYILEPRFSVNSSININQPLSNSEISSLINIIFDEDSIGLFIDQFDIPQNDREERTSEIIDNIDVSISNELTFSAIIYYQDKNQFLALSFINYIIDNSIKEYIAIFPSYEHRISKRNDQIIPISLNYPNYVYYLFFSLFGGMFGTLIGMASDFLKRKIYFEEDVKDYGIPYNVIRVNKKLNDQLFEIKSYKDSIICLQDRLEGVARRSKAKVIGVTNLGNDIHNNLAALLAENLIETGLRILIIDLNLEQPMIHNLYNIDNDVNIAVLLSGELIAPINIKQNLFVIPASKYAYPARFYKEEIFLNYVRNAAIEFDYVFMVIPRTEYYVSLYFNFKVIDILLINTSFGGTAICELDTYLSKIEPEFHDKLLLNSIDIRVRRDIFGRFVTKLLNNKKNK